MNARESRKHESRGRSWRWPRWLLVLMLLGSALATFGGYLHFGGELLSHFQPYYAAVYAGYLLLMFGFRRVRGAFWRPGRAYLITTAGLALHAGQVLWLWVPPTRPDLDAPDPVRVVWLNVQHDVPRRRDLYRYLRRCEADVIALGEVPAHVQDDLKQIPFNPPYRYTRWNKQAGLYLMSRFPLEGGGPVKLTRHREGLETTVLVGRRRLPVLCVHIESKDQVDRQAGIEALTRISASRPQLLLLGDLNMSNWSPWFRRLLRETPLRDGRRGFGLLPSWQWDHFSGLRLPIDHILPAGDIRLRSLEVGPPVRSDHRPLIAEVEVGGARGPGIRIRD